MRNKRVFKFKKFSVYHDQSSMKVGTDGVLLGAWAEVTACESLLDIGTGCGVIALMLAQRTPDWVRIDAIDISEKDFQQALANFESSPWKEKLTAHHTSVQNFHPPHQYDCIVSNPPFFSNSLEPPENERKKARHSTTLTFEQLMDSSIKLLKPSGRLNLILPLTEGNRFIFMAKTNGLYLSRKTLFRTRPDKPVERLLLEFSLIPGPEEASEILLYKEPKTPSEEYRSLTQHFYLNF